MVNRKRNPIPKKDTKPKLLQKRGLVQITKKYTLVEETEEYCFKSGKSIKLHVEHSELNLIVHILVLGFGKNVTFKKNDVKNLLDEAIKNVTKHNSMSRDACEEGERGPLEG